MVVLNKKSIRLPRVEKEKFLLLLRLGLDYNRDLGVYSVKNYNNVDKLLDAISDVLKSEVVFLQSCSVCGKDFPCSSCKYVELCTTKNLPFNCVCPECLIRGSSGEA
jgi:hypothetical protein